ncbi:polyphosphate kinase 2 [Cyanobium gracile]|uniref:ADP/GDP-polyphosphate phosphotransferase n=1 Tax=Cyanobium gracile UHCC 0281 TaxID=3110309 RepID=A0ABU5STG3_9CYAN|nr:polyphosphate kinase 2 [Cyanobium gracile]MEA5441802.1 polyphosphate kinase 2 [Cyanobium gracile UHCC 0281]
MSKKHHPSPAETIEEMQNDLPYDESIDKKDYKRDLEALQIELLKAQRHIKAAGQRLVLLFEGRDAAGKGGSIKRFRQHLNPRGSEHVALPKPNDAELTQWYFQRYVPHLPAAGDITMFDRSWYNRAGVEKVMGFCTPQEHALFLRQVPPFEQSLVSSGILLFKMWFTVSQDRQKHRFADRREDPLKQWKLSPIDEVSVEKYDAYTEARNEMLLATDTLVAPWTIINSNEKRRARLGAIRSVLHALEYEHKDEDVIGEPDPRVVRTAHSLFIDN